METTLGAFAVLAWLAYVASRVLARRNIPELVAFLLVGLAVGPSGLELLDREAFRDLQPVTEVALGVLMFSIGERVSPRLLSITRWPLAVGAVQYVLSFAAVFAALRWADVDPPVALLLAVLAGAGAPMTIASVVASVRAGGTYPGGLVASHAVSDALATVTFAAVLPLARVLTLGEGVGEAAFRFARLGLGGLVLGLVLGWLLARMGAHIETSGELLLFLGVHLLAAWAVADLLGSSLPLAALVAGASSEMLLPRDLSQRQFRVVRGVEQPLYLIFFALAGAGMHLDALGEVGIAGLVYVTVRGAAKIAGGLIGGGLARLGLRRSFQLGVDLLPQAGVAVGLAVLAGERLPVVGGEAATVVLGAVVLFELVGPFLVARGLRGTAAEEAATALGPGEVPEVVLVASELAATPPAWLFDLAHRWHSRLVLVGPLSDEERAAVLERAARDEIDVETLPLDGDALSGNVVRRANEKGADLVVLLTHWAQPGAGSRLVLRPNERIARQVSCPVLVVPLSRS